MKTAILASAQDDLVEGFGFYERQREGLGSYFLECLFSDIESLQLYARIHLKSSAFIDFCQKDSLTPSTTVWRAERFAFGPFWIAVKILKRFGADSRDYVGEHPILASLRRRAVTSW